MNKNRGLLGAYIKKMRKRAGVSVEELCRGLCSAQQLYAVEKGRRGLDKLILDVIMERLGVGAEDYEHLLDYPDYKRWEDRQHILHAITFEEFETAGDRLEEYYAIYCEDESKDTGGRTEAERRLELQFYLCMRTLLKDCTGGTREEVEEGYRHALELTVPELEQQPLVGRVLSLKELNLILEAEHHRADGGRLERYREVLAYIEAGKLDEIGMTKIYPKAVYFLCHKVALVHKVISGRSVAEKESGNMWKDVDAEWTDQRLLQYCDKAYEVLRKGERMYFLWEILSMQEYYMDRLRKQWLDCGETKSVDTLWHMLEERRGFRLILEQVYREFGVRKETFEFCYLYVMKEVYCISDVIRIRRRMLGMKAEVLCEGICTVKTLRNIENRKTVSQRQVSEELLERLGLPKDRTRTEIMTDDSEARRLVSQLRKDTNDKNYEKAGELVKELRKRISAEIPCNQQVLKQQEVLINRYLGKLSNKEYQEKMWEVLEITLPFEAFLKEGKKYLTNEELTCIQNMMINMDTESEEFLLCMQRFEDLYQPIIQAGMHETVANMYEFIMGAVGSLLGNRGEYDRSDEINETIIRGCLRFRRNAALHGGLYGRWWNHNEREKKDIPMDKILKHTEELEKCIQFARFTREYNDVRFYHKKLER